MDDDVDLSKDDLIDDELDDAGEDIAEIETKAEKAKSKKGKESEESAQALEFKRVQMTLLIKQGKERGYLTYAEINDSLPDDMVEGDALDNIVSTFSDLGIQVYEQAPDAEVLLMSDNVPVANADDTTRARAEFEKALQLRPSWESAALARAAIQAFMRGINRTGSPIQDSSV